MNNWSAPAYFKNRGLKTHVMVRFDENGNILAKDIVKSSGNPAFDELVLVAIQKSSPVPAPPAKFSKIASVEGFLFRFSPDSE
jgi:colicin import membrane protein